MVIRQNDMENLNTLNRKESYNYLECMQTNTSFYKDLYKWFVIRFWKHKLQPTGKLNFIHPGVEMRQVNKEQ